MSTLFSLIIYCRDYNIPFLFPAVSCIDFAHGDVFIDSLVERFNIREIAFDR